MTREREAQRPVDGVMNADANRDERVGVGTAVVANLERRGGIEQIEAVVGETGESQGLAEAAGAGGQQPARCAGLQAAVFGHLIYPGNRLQSAEEYATGAAFDLAGDIGAEIAAVDGIHVRMPSGTKENGVPRRWSAMRMGSRIGRVVVRAEIGFDFDDAAGEVLRTVLVFDPMDEDFAKQARSHELRRRLKKRAGQQPAKFQTWVPERLP